MEDLWYNLAGMIQNEIAFVSPTHPYADAVIALINGEDEPTDPPVDPTPDEPEQPTLTGTEVTWSADSAQRNTSAYNLITSVTGIYSDGSTKPVTGYTVLPSIISEGENVLIVSYEGKTATKTIIGVAPQFTPHNVDAKSLAWERGYINASGVVQNGAAQGSYSSSAFDVEGASEITLGIVWNGTDYSAAAEIEAKIAFYDVNNNFIERIIRARTCAVSEGSKYCRVTWGTPLIGNDGWDGTGATISLT